MTPELLQALPATAVFVLLLVQLGAPIVARMVDKYKGNERPNLPDRRRRSDDLRIQVEALREEVQRLSKTLNEVHEVHLGPHALDSRGVPRWWMPEGLVEVLADLRDVLTEVKTLMLRTNQ